MIPSASRLRSTACCSCSQEGALSAKLRAAALSSAGLPPPAAGAALPKRPCSILAWAPGAALLLLLLLLRWRLLKKSALRLLGWSWAARALVVRKQPCIAQGRLFRRAVC